MTSQGGPPAPNPIARILQAILGFALSLLQALIGGLLRAPLTAAQTANRPIDVRRGQPDEVVAVRHAVLREGRPVEEAVFEGDEDPSTRHWVAERAGMVVGVVSVMRRPLPPTEGAPDPAPTLQLRGMAVLPEYRGSGLGAALLASVHAEVDAPMWCNARERAVPFYARHGWRPLGAPFELPPIGPHQRMWWRP